MARATVELPSVLQPVVRGRHSIPVDAPTLRAALEHLTTEHPELEVHLFDESGAFRQHVLCFHNRTNSRWLDSLDVPLEEGDVIRIVQAVSGG